MSEVKWKTKPVVAVVGGGQLARMMQESAIALGVHLRVLVEESEGATGQVVVDAPVGDPSKNDDMETLIQGASVLTFEHEHIPQEILNKLLGKIPINPAPHALLYAQDKLAMREKLTEIGVPCPRWKRIDTAKDIEIFADEVGWPIIVKTPVGGYDGHGVRVVTSVTDVADWLKEGGPLLAEEKIPFTAELAGLTARRPSGEIRSWPLVQTIQENGVCSVVIAPAPNIVDEILEEAQTITETIARELDVTGVLAVEMFLLNDPISGIPHLAVNELAMRPHNSGHWTIDGAVTSQFEQHIRAVLDLPLGDPSPRNPATVMVNLLGSQYEDPAVGLPMALAISPKVKVHLYGKSVRPGRKLGHVTVSGTDAGEARELAQRAVNALRGE